MRRFLKNSILLSLILLLSVWGWTFYHQRQSALQEESDLVEINKVKAKANVTETATQEQQSNKQQNTRPDLNLNIKSSSSELSDRILEQGPKPESISPSTSSSKTSLPSINELLPEKPTPKKYLKYGYEGKEEERHNLKLDIQKDDLNVKLGVQADKDRNTNINSIDIEVKLPD